MNWFGRKFRNAPNEMLSESDGEEGSLGTHLGEWIQLGEGITRDPEITLVTSLIDASEELQHEVDCTEVHAPVLDIDIEHVYYPSTTPGHAALLLNVNLSRPDYFELLAALLKCGIIEQGFHDASIQRGYSACRTPWTKKPAKSPE